MSLESVFFVGGGRTRWSVVFNALGKGRGGVGGGGADGSQQLGEGERERIRNASAIYVETQLAPYAPKWLPGAWQQKQHLTVQRGAEIFRPERLDCFQSGGLTAVKRRSKDDDGDRNDNQYFMCAAYYSAAFGARFFSPCLSVESVLLLLRLFYLFFF